MTHIDPADPAVDPVELIAHTLDAVALDAVANRSTPSATVLRSIAGDLLDELLADERTPPPAVERDVDAVRIVDEVLRDSLGLERIDAAEAVVRALLGIPTVTRHDDDGRLTVDWHDTPSHRPRACIVARDLLDDIVERLQPEPSDPDQNHATPERTAEPGERLPDLPASAYPPGAVPLPDVVRTVPCGDPEHCASHGECIDYADEVPEGGLVPTGESGVSKSPDGTR